MPDRFIPGMDRKQGAPRGRSAGRMFLRAKLWALSNLFEKQIIYWQDRLGLFRYQDWIAQVESARIRTFLSRESGRSFSDLRVSFILTDALFEQQALERTLESLRCQKNLTWNLVFVLPKTSSLRQTGWFQALLASEQRLSVAAVDDHESPGGWIQVSKDAACSGEWLVPLHAGDRLSAAWARIFGAFAAQANGAEIVYWDEDTLDSNGKRTQPFFKPGWSPELLPSINYLETAAFRKSLARRYLESGGSQAEDWIFGVTQAAGRIVHVPFVLQHRSRLSIEGRSLRLEQHASAARRFFEHQGYSGVKAEIRQGCVRLRWRSEQPLVSIIIPTKNNLHYLRRCITSLLEKTSYPHYEILLMDDHSTDPDVLAYYQEIQKTSPVIHIHKNEGPFNYSRVNNQGARYAQGSLLLFLNNDVEITNAEWLDELVRWALLPGVGIAGAKLLYPDELIQHAGIVLGMTGHANHLFAGKPPARSGLFLSSDCCRNVSAVTGACMLARRDVFDQIGGFNEDLPLVFNDVEICLRALKHGYRIVYNPASCLIHYEGRSRARYIPKKDIRVGANLLQEAIASGDCYYNPNLSLSVNWPTFRRKNEMPALSRLEQIVLYKG